jgi:cystathionine gamma-synthase
LRPTVEQRQEIRARRLRPATEAVMAGRGPAVSGLPLNPPPVFASAFHANGSHSYGREGNPTWEAFEEALGVLEGGHGIAFSSGMAAVAAVLEDLPVGSCVVVPGDAYFELRALLGDRARSGRLEVRTADATDTEAIIAALDGADLVWLESLTNPLLDVCEVDAIVRASRRRGVTSIVDATLATPALQRPLELGADVVVHSASKYIGGHSDLLLGAAATRDRDRAERMRRARAGLGAVPGTMEAFLALRGLRTLPLRLERSCATAAELARRLARHPAVERVRYPGLPGDPGHRRAVRLLEGFGGMVACQVRGGDDRAASACASVRVWTHATSLGGVESLIEHRFHPDGPRDLPPGLLRMSVGCEEVDDLWDDLDSALRSRGAFAAAATRRRPPSRRTVRR